MRKPRILLSSHENKFEEGHLEIGQWSSFEVVADSKETNQLDIPLIPSKKIIVTIDYNGDLELPPALEDFSKDSYSETDIYFPDSFPTAEMLFLPENLRRQSSLYEFRINTHPHLKNDYPTTFEELIRLTPQYIKQRHCLSNEDQYLVELYQKIVMENNLVDRVSLKKTILQIYEFVIDHKVFNPEDATYETRDISHLLQRYESIGAVSGDCKALSTFTAALLSSLGFTCRRISGYLVKEDDAEGIRENYDTKIAYIQARMKEIRKLQGPSIITRNEMKRIKKLESERESVGEHEIRTQYSPHTWIEYLMPSVSGSKTTWSVIDTSYETGIVGSYPPFEDIVYTAICTIPQFISEQKQFRIKVDYN